jgi:HEPN domain-containing protein
LICYLCQQAAEKAYKAYLAWLRDDRIPFTHDIEKLRQRSLRQGGEELPEEPAELTPYEASGRYPFLSPITEGDVRAALDLAQDALSFVRHLIGLD